MSKINSINVINNIFRFYPWSLLVIFVVQVLSVVLSLGGRFPVYYEDVNSLIAVIFSYIFMYGFIVGFATIFLYPISKLKELIIDKNNKKKAFIDLSIFFGGHLVLFLVIVVLEKTTRYMSWLMD